MKNICKLLGICIFCFFFLGCGPSKEEKRESFRSHVEKRVHNRIKKKMNEYKDFSGTEIQKFELIPRAGNEYSGKLTVKVKDEVLEVAVSVTADEYKILWEIPKSEQDKILKAKHSW